MSATPARREAGESGLDAASVHAVAREVAKILGRRGAESLMTASEVALCFNVERGWVYAHAADLGVIRIGDGPRPRLRFDPAVVAQRLVVRPGREPPVPPSSQVRARAPLLPIRPQRRRRNLDQR